MNEVRANAGIARATARAYDPGVRVTMQLAVDVIGTWAHAVELQAARIHEGARSFADRMADMKADTYMLAVAVRNLMRAVEGAKKTADRDGDGALSKQLGVALAAFNAAVPDAVRFRDVVEYLDVYNRGEGKEPVGQIVPMLSSTSAEPHPRVSMHLTGELVLNDSVAAEAAIDLAAAAQTALLAKARRLNDGTGEGRAATAG